MKKSNPFQVYGFVVAVLFASNAFAQPVQTYDEKPLELKKAAPRNVASTTTPVVTADDAMTVRVAVEHGITEKKIPNAVVFLRAARKRGPFEPVAPKPKYEWTAVADANGIATFPAVPKNLDRENLMLHGVASFSGMVFSSPSEVPSANRTLTVPVYDRGPGTTEGIEYAKIRNVVEVWEGYLIIRQTYSIRNSTQAVIDTKMLADPKFEKGLAIELPVKAQGIRAFGSGETVVVNSTVYWAGMIRPQETVQLQVHYSMSAKKPEFAFTQRVDFPTDDVEVVVPLQTQFKKMPRLNTLELRPKEFKVVDKGPGIFGLRKDVDFVGARDLKLKSGDSFEYQLRGLPFEVNRKPWLAVALGLLLGIIAIFVSRRYAKEPPQPKKVVLENLRQEESGLLAALVTLEEEFATDRITESELQLESLAIRERLALVMKKIEDISNA